jgi:hypothetical protein
VVAAVILVYGIVTRDVLLGLLGVAMLVIQPPMIAFGKRIEARRKTE